MRGCNSGQLFFRLLHIINDYGFEGTLSFDPWGTEHVLLQLACGQPEFTRRQVETTPRQPDDFVHLFPFND